MKTIEQQLTECNNGHYYMSQLLQKQGNHGELEQIRTNCHLCCDNQDYRNKINEFMGKIK
jgi:hypothetical protein